MKQISLLLTVFLCISSHSLCMDDFYEQFKDAQSSEQFYEDIYSFLRTEKKLTESEIHHLAHTAPTLITLALQDCKHAGKLTQETLSKLLAYLEKISRSSKEFDQLKKTLIKQTEACGTVEVIILTAKATEVEQFKEFVHTKQNLNA